MIYLRAGLYAEGPSDYHFLCRLLDRLIDALAASLFPSDYELADTLGIDAPFGMQAKRAERIAAAIVDARDLCELFVVHADGAGDPDAARANNVDPGIAEARARSSDRTIPAAACVPVREIEAWMLADPEPFRDLLGRNFTPALPDDPERDLDPKATLRRILIEGGARRVPGSIHAFFGERVHLTALRALPAFRSFEQDLTKAIREVATGQGRP